MQERKTEISAFKADRYKQQLQEHCDSDKGILPA